MIRVLIADDHAVVRQGLRTFLELQEDIDVVGEAADGAQALQAAAALEPDVVLMDLVMPELDGVAAIERLRERAPATRVLVLTSFLDEDKVLPAIRAGAAGYLLKDVEPAELVRAIRTVDGGDSQLHPAVAARVLRELAGEAEEGDGTGDGRSGQRHGSLTARELEVLRCSRAAARTRRSPSSSASRRRPSRPTSATSSPSSAYPIAPRPRCTRCARGSPTGPEPGARIVIP